jgi:diacylglycerol kinase family enzyme
MATMFYDKAYNVVPMGIKAWLGGGEIMHESKKPRLFVAMGASGNRQYGSNKRILPDANNVIAVCQTSFVRKLLVKGAIESGRHDNVREVEHFTASKLELEYTEKQPLQCDGEVEELARCDFPLVMELIPSLYNVIVPASGATS